MNKKILFIASMPPPLTGQSIATKVFYDKLIGDGFDVDVISTRKNNFKNGFDSFGRVIDILRILWRVLFLRKKYDMIYFTVAESLFGNLKDILILLFLKRQIGKTWIHLHGGAGMRVILSDKRSILSKVNKFYLGRVKGVIVLGERLRGVYEGYLEDSRIKTLINFSPEEAFSNENKIHQKWDSEEINVLYLSNLLPGKGYDDLLKSAIDFNSKSDWRFNFNFAGGFESEEDKNNFLDKIKNLKNVKYHGVVSGAEKKRLLEISQIFCLPTYYPYEGQPISILEAYASGMLVLTTNHSGIFDIFSPEVNGFEVYKKDYLSINASLIRVSNDREFCKNISVNNFNMALSKFTKETHLNNFYKLLEITKG